MSLRDKILSILSDDLAEINAKAKELQECVEDAREHLAQARALNFAAVTAIRTNDAPKILEALKKEDTFNQIVSLYEAEKAKAHQIFTELREMRKQLSEKKDQIVKEATIREITDFGELLNGLFIGEPEGVVVKAIKQAVSEDVFENTIEQLLGAKIETKPANEDEKGKGSD